MIAAVQQTLPQLSLRQISGWLGVSRSWYPACPSAEERAARDVALRDAIERIILDLPGYGFCRLTSVVYQSDLFTDILGLDRVPTYSM